MKHLVYILPLCLILAACEFHASENGDLDGFWQMTQIDTLETGSETDVREDLLFYSFYVHLMTAETPSYTAYFRFTKSADSLILYSPTDGGRTDNDITDISKLQPMGINRLREGFLIEGLTSDLMILKSQELRLHFRKY